MRHARSETTRIIASFGDISGFTTFIDSITNKRTEYDPLMHAYDDLIEQAARETGYSFKDTGDGFMCSVDLCARQAGSKAVEVLVNLWKLLKKIEALFNRRRDEFLAPDGFRIVVATGYVFRTVKKNGDVLLRGKHINTAHNALDRARGHGLVCHFTLKQLINEKLAKKHGISFSSLDNHLWVVRIGG